MNGRKPFSLQSQTGNVDSVACTGALVSVDFCEVGMWEVQCRLETVGALRVCLLMPALVIVDVQNTDCWVLSRELIVGFTRAHTCVHRINC